MTMEISDLFSFCENISELMQIVPGSITNYVSIPTYCLRTIWGTEKKLKKKLTLDINVDLQK